MNAEPFQDDAFPHDEPDEDSVVSRHPGQSAFYLVVSMLVAFFVVGPRGHRSWASLDGGMQHGHGWQRNSRLLRQILRADSHPTGQGCNRPVGSVTSC